MSEARMRILEMLEQGKITATEAADLLRAIDGDRANGAEGPGRRERGERPVAGAEGKPRWFRVRVTDTATGKAKANVSIPYNFINVGLRFAPGDMLFGKRGMGRGPQGMDEMMEALRQGRRGTIYDVTDERERQRIEIIVE
jgi:hypothetical protein